MVPRLILKAGKEKPILNGHPWVFSGAVKKIEGDPKIGQAVIVVSHDNTYLGMAAYSPHSQIRARMWTLKSTTEVNEEFFNSRLRKAVKYRNALIDLGYINRNAYRLVFSESDYLPGLIVDQYANLLVVQFLTAGMEYWRETIIEQLNNITSIQTIYERSDGDVRNLEGLESKVGWISGMSVQNPTQIIENDIHFFVDYQQGQKTGFYLDQFENRKKIRHFLNDKKVLDCFSYTGGFSITSLVAKAKDVTAIESSANSIQLAQKNMELNNLNRSKCKWINGDVFTELRKFRDADEKFDVIILDPPKFAATSSQIHRAARGYKDINLLALKLLIPGGILITFSCSGGISASLFQKIVNDASVDAGKRIRIINRLHQASDHPVTTHFPESEYLKGLICQICE